MGEDAPASDEKKSDETPDKSKMFLISDEGLAIGIPVNWIEWVTASIKALGDSNNALVPAVRNIVAAGKAENDGIRLIHMRIQRVEEKLHELQYTLEALKLSLDKSTDKGDYVQ